MYLREKINQVDAFSGFWAGVGNFFSNNALGQAALGIGTTAAGVAITSALAPDPPKQSAPAPVTGGTYGPPPASAPQVIVVERDAPKPQKETESIASYVPYIMIGLAVLKFIKSK